MILIQRIFQKLSVQWTNTWKPTP